MMKNVILLTIVLFPFLGTSQTVDSASIKSKLIEAFLSKPQPRLKQYSSITINPSDIIDTLFYALPQADRINLQRQSRDELHIASIRTDKLGRYSIGSMHFLLNQTNYYTKEIKYEVIDSLPKTDKGLWIRMVFVNDSIFCLILEQRIPYKKGIGKDKNTSYPTFEEQMKLTAFSLGQEEKNLMFISSSGTSSVNSYFLEGVEKYYLYGENYNFIRINNRSAKIRLTKDNFIKLPDDYVFEDIIIQ